MPRGRGSVTPADVALYTEVTGAIAPMSPAAVAEGLRLIVVRSVPRGAHFLRAGARATDVAIVAEGWLREYYLFDGGVERNKAFVFEGDASGSLADLMSDEPSRTHVIAEASARLLCWPYQAYRALSERSAEWARFHVTVVERLFLHKARREYELLGLDAEGRYRALLERVPRIEQRVPARHIASYLGI